MSGVKSWFPVLREGKQERSSPYIYILTGKSCTTKTEGRCRNLRLIC